MTFLDALTTAPPELEKLERVGRTTRDVSDREPAAT